MKRVCLSIAGLDPSASAGIFSDLKVFEIMGCRGMAIASVLTAQSANGVRGTYNVPDAFILEQLQELVQNYSFSALKIGVISESHLKIISKFIKNNNIENVVLDPILKSSSGYEFISPEALKEISMVSSILTPNSSEAEILSGYQILNTDDQIKAAKLISEKYLVKAVLVKGGHLNGDISEVTDILYYKNEIYQFKNNRITLDSDIRGTGCVLSSLIASNLALGRDMVEAVSISNNKMKELIRNSSKKNSDKNYTFSF